MKLLAALALLAATALAETALAATGEPADSIGGAVPAVPAVPAASAPPVKPAPAALSYALGPRPDGQPALQAAPDSRAAEISKLPEGALFLVVERVPGWVRVRLPSGETGWLAARLVGCCRAPPP